MKNSENTTYVGLDFMKVFAAFTVVIIHTYPGLEFGLIGQYFWRVVSPWAVPFFFCCSGFFLSKTIRNDGFPWKTIKRLFTFYCIWTVIYLPINLVDIKTFLANFFIFGTSYHLWYIPALLYSIILIALIKNNKILIVASLLLFILGVLGSSYFYPAMKVPLLKEIVEDYNFFDKFRRIFSLGLPFTVLGYILAQKISKIEPFIKDKTARLLAIVIFLYLVEMGFILYFRLDRDVVITFLLYILVASFFFRGLYLPLKNVDNLKEKGAFCRSIANSVYFVHPWVLFVLYYLKSEIVTNLPTLTCFIVFFTSVLIGYVIIKINNPYLNRLIQ